MRTMTFQADVTEPLASAGNIMAKGHRIVLDDEDAYILHKATKRRVKLYRKGNVIRYEDAAHAARGQVHAQSAACPDGRQEGRREPRRVSGDRTSAVWRCEDIDEQAHEEVCPAEEIHADEGQEAGEGGGDAEEGPREEESEEARPAVPVRDPGAPTREEYERHMLTHMAYRAWRPWCIIG